jgi:hypothetical protein
MSASRSVTPRLYRNSDELAEFLMERPMLAMGLSTLLDCELIALVRVALLICSDRVEGGCDATIAH